MIRGAVEVEREFICDALSCDLIGMNKGLMSTYKFVCWAVEKFSYPWYWRWSFKRHPHVVKFFGRWSHDSDEIIILLLRTRSNDNYLKFTQNYHSKKQIHRILCRSFISCSRTSKDLECQKSIWLDGVDLFAGKNKLLRKTCRWLSKSWCYESCRYRRNREKRSILHGWRFLKFVSWIFNAEQLAWMNLPIWRFVSKQKYCLLYSLFLPCLKNNLFLDSLFEDEFMLYVSSDTKWISNI